MRKASAVDLFILALVFWAAWSLRFLGVGQIGLVVMIAGVGVGLVLQKARGWSWAELGFTIHGGIWWNVRRGLEAAGAIGLAAVVGIGLARIIDLPVEASSVIVEQPDGFPAFLIDLIVGGWIGAAVGEEIFFRGIVLDRLRKLLPVGQVGLAAAVAVQAAWFASGHVSQGLGGMLAVGLIAIVIAVFYLTRARMSLLPVIIGHGIVDTISLTAAFAAG